MKKMMIRKMRKVDVKMGVNLRVKVKVEIIEEKK